MKCKFCGNEFEQPKRGRKKEYCNAPWCVNKAHNETRKKYLARKAGNIEEEVEAVEQDVETIKERIDQARVVCSNNEELALESVNKNKIIDISELMQLGREYGAIRLKLIEEAKKCQAHEKLYNNEEQNVLHEIESEENITEQQACEMVAKLKKIREPRRIVKNRNYLIQEMLKSMLMRNPPRFVSLAIQRSKNWKYITKVVAELKEDKELYTKEITE